MLRFIKLVIFFHFIPWRGITARGGRGSSKWKELCEGTEGSSSELVYVMVEHAGALHELGPNGID